jgi:DNA-binding transcriptional LysR family regulator
VELRKIDLNLLLLLDVLIEERSVTRTAKRLSMTQPALSNALNRLREMLNDPLLERSNEGMEPTPYALSIAKPIKRILNELGDLFAQKADFDPLETTRCFTIAMESMLTGLTLPLSRKLKLLAPQASLRVQQFVYRENKPLIDPEADVLINFSNLGFSGVMHAPLFVDDLVAVVRRDHPHAKCEITLEEFAYNFDQFLVEHSIAKLGNDYFDGLLSNLGIQRSIKLRMPISIQDQLQLIASSDFVSVWPRRWALKANALFGSPFAIMEIPQFFRDMTKWEIGLFWEERYTHDPCNRWLRQMIMDVCREEYGPQLAAKNLG